jgi:CRP-like cAMP-binding protein
MASTTSRISKRFQRRRSSRPPTSRAARRPRRFHEIGRAPLPGSDPARFRAAFEILRELDAFAIVSDGELARFAALGRERRVPRGDILCDDANPAPATLALLLEGQARLTRGRGPGEPMIRALEAGDLLGEAAMFDEAFDEETARAQTSVRLLEWDGDALREALRRWPDVGWGLLGSMAKGQREMRRRLAGICRQRAPRRLARALEGLLQDRGVRQRDEAGGAVLRLRRMPSRARLAEVAGMARETATRLLSEWERRGWLGFTGEDLLVLDEHALRRVAGDAP